MSQAKSGDKVKVHYTGTLDDGSTFDTSSGRDPLEFTIGEGQVIRGFEDAVIGMNAGESTTTKILAEDAYGPHREEMVIVVDRARLPQDLNPHVGEQLEIRRPDGQFFAVMITGVSEADITLDANHPLAGKNLTFNIELVEIA